MTLTFSRLLADGWAAFRRETVLILSIAGPFLFLPAYALRLLTDPLPLFPGVGAEQAVVDAWLVAFEAWGNANARWYLLAGAVTCYGEAVVATLLLLPGRPTVAAAMRAAALRYPRFLIAGILVNLATGLGFLALILPGLILYARLALVVPVVADRGVSAIGALRDSLRATRGLTLPMLGALVMLLAIEWLALMPVAPLAGWLREPGHDNPFVIALVDGIVTAINAGHGVAVLMIGIVAYRRLARHGT